MKHIFVVDDEKSIREIVKKYIEKENYLVTTFHDGSLIINEIPRLKPDLIVMDIMMPNSDGLEICKQIRRKYDIPIIFISARGEEIDRIIGLELGAEDYLVKPFSPRELVVRIKNILKRNERYLEKPVDHVTYKDLSIDHVNRVISVSNTEIKLTQKEYDVLSMLITEGRRPLSREFLLEKIWGYDFMGETRVVDDVIKRLRKKMTELECQCEIETIWGYGYKLGE